MDQSSDLDFYQNHLNRVSRSFALCISRLEGPLRKWVSVTYLVCRILDTVEDARWNILSKQLKSFKDFDGFIHSSSTLKNVREWATAFPNSISDGEQMLLADAERILQDFHSGPLEFKMPIQRLVRSMSAGMRHFAESKTPDGLRLKGLSEVNQYCFFVAGIVGETLAKLLSAVDSKIKLTRDTLVDAHHFGLFLQKVNLLKDQKSDEAEGRFLIPSREKIYKSLGIHAEGAMRYISSIPKEQLGYRIFCLWSLLLGLKTLPLLRDGEHSIAPLKISRADAMGLFDLIEAYASDDEKIYAVFCSLIAESDLTLGNPFGGDKAQAPQWLREIYEGDLNPQDLSFVVVQ